MPSSAAKEKENEIKEPENPHHTRIVCYKEK